MDQNEVKKITDYLFIESRPEPVDLAIIFGSRHQEPLDKVYELYQQGYVKKVLLSGGVNKKSGQIEADEMAKNLKQMGVIEEDLILERESTNTLENVLFSLKLIEDQLGWEKVKKIAAIVKHYHSRRSLMTLKKHFPKTVEIVPVCYEIYGFTRENWSDSEVGREKVMHEWENIPIYLAKGDIEEL